MSTAEFFFKSILLEGKGVHALTWDEKGDLTRALIIFFSVFDEISIHSLLLSSRNDSDRELRSLFAIRPFEEINYERIYDEKMPLRESFLLLFLDQAVSSHIGPLLNGWRSALAQPPGTLLVIRSADLIDFQRNAPDIASFIGPKILDVATLLSIWSNRTAKKIKAKVPIGINRILKKLPGDDSSEEEIAEWINAHPATDHDKDVGNEYK